MIRQVSVFLQNEGGKLGKVLSVLENADINIRSLTIAETSDYGILRLILSDTDKALIALKEAHIMASVTPVMAAAVPDCPGGLSKLVNALGSAGINMAYAYSFLPKNHDNAVVIFRVNDEDMERAKEVLQDQVGVSPLERNELLES